MCRRREKKIIQLKTVKGEIEEIPQNRVQLMVLLQNLK